MHRDIESFVEGRVGVVLGGTRWSEDVNQPAIHVAKALSGITEVLYVCRASQTSGIRRFLGQGLSDQADHLALRSSITPYSSRLQVLELGGLPSLFPLQYPELLRRIQGWVIAREVDRALRFLKWNRPRLIWAIWWFFPEMLTIGGGARSVFDVIDEHDSYGHNTLYRRQNDRAWALAVASARAADVTAVVSDRLRQRLSSEARVLTLAPNGIDLARVAGFLQSEPVDDDGAHLPMIGYFGGDGGRIDWTLVQHLTEALPDVKFDFVGCSSPPGIRLGPNISFAAPVPYGEALGRFRQCSVGLIPFRRTGQTLAASFLKLMDYLACGRPVVAADLPAVSEVARQIPEWVVVPKTSAGWVAEIRRYLAAPPSGEEALSAFLHEHSTESRVESILRELLNPVSLKEEDEMSEQQSIRDA